MILIGFRGLLCVSNGHGHVSMLTKTFKHGLMQSPGMEDLNSKNTNPQKPLIILDPLFSCLSDYDGKLWTVLSLR